MARLIILLLLASLEIGSSVQAAAAPSPTPAPASGRTASLEVRPSEAEALAFAKAFSPSDLRRGAELRMLQEGFVSTLQKDATTAAMLKAFPDLGPALLNAMESQIDLYMSEYDDRFFPQVAEIARRDLSRDELRSLTDFYLSPLGRKVLQTASSNLDGSEVAERSLKGQAVDQEVARRQMLASGWAVLGTLSPDERSRMLAFAASPAGKRFFSVVLPKVTELQLELINSPGPKFTAASQKAMAEAFKRVTGIDPNEPE